MEAAWDDVVRTTSYNRSRTVRRISGGIYDEYPIAVQIRAANLAKRAERDGGIGAALDALERVLADWEHSFDSQNEYEAAWQHHMCEAA